MPVDAITASGLCIEARVDDGEDGRIHIAGLSFAPLHALQLALEIERVAGAAHARQHQLHGAQPRLPLFETTTHTEDRRNA